ncbi:MAG: Choice-of-anchor protein, partial [Bacteroidota bacterium]|nr:Choice-of-anchor protein [Bacteroidota bacterium]
MNRYLLLFLITLMLLPLTKTEAQNNKYDKAKLKKEAIKDKLLYNSAQGREFWIAIPPNEVPGYSPNVLELYVTSGKKTAVTLEMPTSGMTLTKPIDPMEITTYSSGSGEITFQLECRESEQITDKGIRLTAEQPISVYVLNAKVYTSEGYLAIPLASWGTTYIHNSYYDFNEIDHWASGFIVVSAYNDSKIKIDLKGRGYAHTYMGKALGETIRETLHSGQVYMVRGDATTRGEFDLSGTKISSSKPIGLISFHMRTIIPSYDIYNGRDCLSEMLPPVQSWGKKYCTVEYKRDSGKGDFFRIISSEDNTDFTCEYFDVVDGKKLGTWQGQLKKAGDFEEYLEASITVGHPLKSIRGMSIFEATKPVLVCQYAYSADWDGNAIFDPYMIIVVPTEQYIPSTVFQTPSNKSFVDNWFNIIAIGDTSDPKREDLKSVKLDDRAIYIEEPAFLYNQIPGTNLFWAKVHVQPGAHKVVSDTKFGGYIYGFSNWDSYGWPAAMAINKLDETDTLEPELYLSDNCGNYTIKATELRNGAPGDDPRQVDQGINDVQLLDGSFNYILDLPPLIPFPPVYEYTFYLNVENPLKPAFAIFAVTDRAGNIALDSVRYEPDSLALDPKVLSFGDVRLKYDKTLTAMVKNISDSTINIKSISLETSSVFEIISSPVPPDTNLESGGELQITIRYTPINEGLTLNDKDIDSIIVETRCLKYKWEVNGRGVVPRIQVEDWYAGAVVINKKVCKTEQTGTGLLIRNPGTMPLTVNKIAGVKPPFSISNPTNPALPFTIPAGGSVYLEEICFTPPDTNSYSIDVLFESDAEGIDSISTWTGRGLIPGPYINAYNWYERRVNTVHNSNLLLKNAGNSNVRITDFEI